MMEWIVGHTLGAWFGYLCIFLGAYSLAVHASRPAERRTLPWSVLAVGVTMFVVAGVLIVGHYASPSPPPGGVGGADSGQGGVGIASLVVGAFVLITVGAFAAMGLNVWCEQQHAYRPITAENGIKSAVAVALLVGVAFAIWNAAGADDAYLVPTIVAAVSVGLAGIVVWHGRRTGLVRGSAIALLLIGYGMSIAIVMLIAAILVGEALEKGVKKLTGRIGGK